MEREDGARKKKLGKIEFLINKYENLEKFLLEVERIKKSRFKFRICARSMREIGNRFLEIGTSSKIQLNLFVLYSFKRDTREINKKVTIFIANLSRFVDLNNWSNIEEKLYTYKKFALSYIASNMNKKYRCSGFLVRQREPLDTIAR